MATENLVKLMEFAQEKPELASKIGAVTGSEQIVAIGAAEGLEFTTEEAEAFRQQLIQLGQKPEDGELNEEDLEAVAGGMMQAMNPIKAVGSLKKLGVFKGW